MGAPRKYKLTQTIIMAAWADKFECVRTWLSKQNGTKASRALHLWYFCDWTGKSPDELLALKSDYGCLEAEQQLDLFVAEADFPESTRFKSSIAVRSFFRCNYRQLESEAGKIDYVPQKERPVPSKQQRRELYRWCLNPRNKALFCVDACSGMALETLSKLKLSYFEEGWQRRDIPHIHLLSNVIKGHGRGKYKGVMQETFLTPEAKRELLSYMDWMTRKYGVIWRDDMNVFLSLDSPHGALGYQGIAGVFVEVSKLAGVPFSSHDGRRILQTALENAGVMENFIRKVKGRKVRGEDNPYSRPYVEMLREKYRLVVPELEFLSGGVGEGAGALTADQQRFYGEIARLFERFPDKAEKFERFLMEL